MADDTDQQQPPQQTLDLNAAIQALIQQQLRVASGQGQQVQLPSAQPPPSQYSNDPSQGPDLLGRIGLALGGGALPGAPAELRAQMGRQALMNFGIGLMSAGKFATPGEVLAGGLRGAQAGLLGSEATQAAQQEYALNAQAKLAELGLAQQKNRTEALQAVVPLLQMQGRLGLPPLFGPGAGPGGGGGGGGGPALTGDIDKDQQIIAQRESGGDPTALNYVARADPTAYGRGATASGKYQFVNSTWQEGLKLAGVENPGQYPTAMSAPEAVQDQVFRAVYGKYGTAPWDPSKFKQTWVPTPTGQFILAHAVPGGSVGPVKAPPPAAPGGLTAGATVTAAPTAPGVPPPPEAPPGAATTPYPEAGAGIGRVLAGTAAQSGPTQVTVTPPPSGRGTPIPTAGKLQTTGRPPGQTAADIIQSGMTLAQAGMPPGTVAAAGPAAGTPPPTAPTPESGWGTVVGSYGGAPTGPITPPPAARPQPPAAQPPSATPPTPPPAQQPPAPTPAPASRAHDYSVQDTDLTPEEYQDRHFVPLTPEQVRTYAPGPSGDVAAAAADQVQRARANLQVQQTQLQRMTNAQIPADAAAIARQDGQVTDAQTALNTAENTYNKAVQDAAQAGAGRLLERDNAERARVSADYKASVIDPRNKAAELTQQGQQAVELEQAKAGTLSQQKVMDSLNESRESARNALDQIDAARTFSRAAGDTTFWQQVQQSHPEFVQMLANIGGLSTQDVQQLGYAKAMDAAMQKMISMARTGTGFQRMTNLDVSILTSQAPEGTDPQAWREAKLSYLQNFMQRQLHYVDTVRALTAGKNGKSVYDAQKQAEAENGPVIPQVPTFTDLPGSTASQQRGAWARKNNVTPGTFVLDPEGNLIIAGAGAGGPRQQPPPQPSPAPQPPPTL